MEIFEIISGILLIVSCVIVITLVLMQESSGKGLGGSITGEGNSNATRSKSRSMNAMLVRWTKVVAIAMFVITLAINVFIRFAQ